MATLAERQQRSKRSRTQPYAHQLAALRRLANVLGADVSTIANGQNKQGPANDTSNQDLPRGGGENTGNRDAVGRGGDGLTDGHNFAIGKRQREAEDVGDAANQARVRQRARAASASADMQPNTRTQGDQPVPVAPPKTVSGQPPNPPPKAVTNPPPNAAQAPRAPSKPSTSKASTESSQHNPPHKSSSQTKGREGPSGSKGARPQGAARADSTAEDDCMTDAETIASLYEDKQAPQDQTIVLILKLLEALVKKVDEILSKPTHQGSENQPPPAADKRAPEAQFAVPKPNQARRRAKPQVWDQTLEDNRPAGVRTREPARTAVLVYIRSCFLNALGLASPKEQLPPGPPIDVEAPTHDNFYLKWDESHRSEFNQIACQLITDQVVKDWPVVFTGDNWDDLFKMVTEHAKYLIRRYKREQLPPEDESKHNRHLASSANRRMHTTWENRMHVIDSVPTLMTHRQLILDLGIDGTSSDEEDPNEPRTYKVKRIKQFSSSLRELKRKLDEAYEILEKGPRTRGSQGRKRVRTNEPSTQAFRIKGLPINCINCIWYQRLTDAQKAYFKFSDYEYDFSFPDEVLKM